MWLEGLLLLAAWPPLSPALVAAPRSTRGEQSPSLSWDSSETSPAAWSIGCAPKLLLIPFSVSMDEEGGEGAVRHLRFVGEVEAIISSSRVRFLGDDAFVPPTRTIRPTVDECELQGYLLLLQDRHREL